MTPGPPPRPEADARVTDPTYVGLLNQLMNNTLDEDYRVVAARRSESAAGRSSTPVLLVVVLAVFGIMLGVSAWQTERDRPQDRAEREELIEQIEQRKAHLEGLQSDLGSLLGRVAGLQGAVASSSDDLGSLNDRLDVLGVDAGTLAATGPGLTIVVDDAADSSPGTGGTILDTDLRQLVNGLWEAGAEAIAIDGHRLSSLTSIRFAGQAITVDYRSLTAPYTVTILGDPDTLPARFNETAGGQSWIGLEANFGIRYDVATADRLTVPADPRDRLLHARPKEAR